MSAPPSTALDALTKALLKRLANSHDGFDRARAVRIVGRWLKSRPTLDSETLLRIWRGLFYCFWMSDKVPVQQQLAADLADMMLPPLPTDRAMLVLQTFLHTLQREWTSIDQLRMDKFMTLVRRFVHRGFLVVAKAGWAKDDVEQLTEMYIEPEGATLAHDSVARGFFLHVTDTWLTELERAAADAAAANKNAEPLHFDALNTLLTPFYHIVALCRDRSMVERVQKEVFQPLLQLCFPMPEEKPAKAKKSKAKAEAEEDDEDMEESDDEEEEEEEEDESNGIAAQFPHLHNALQGASVLIADTFRTLASAKDDAITGKARKNLYSLDALFRGVEDAAAAELEEAEEQAAKEAERAVAQKQANARAAVKQQQAWSKKRKAEAALDEDGEGDEAAQLEPGVGSEGLSVLVKERAKKRNKKQRLAAKRRKAEAILGAEPGKQSQQAAGQEEEDEEEQHSGEEDEEEEELDEAAMERAMLDELGSDEELEFAELGSGEDIDEEDEDAEMEDEDDEEEEAGSDEAEEEETPAVPVRLSAKEAKRLAQALEDKKQAQKQQQQVAGGKKKIAPVPVQDAPTTPPKPKAQQRKAAPAAAATAAAAAPAFLTPQPSKKTVSHASPSGAASKGASKQPAATCIKATAAPPSSTKKNVQIVLANNKVREFKRWARDSISVETPVLLAKPSPRSAIKPESIAFFLQHNKNGQELAAKRQALAQQFNEAAENGTPIKKGRTPPVSPRSKAADFF